MGHQHSLDWLKGTSTGKPLIFNGKKTCKKLKTMVSCRFSHQPIHLNMEYEKQPRDHSYGETRHDWDSDSPRNGSLKNR